MRLNLWVNARRKRRSVMVIMASALSVLRVADLGCRSKSHHQRNTMVPLKHVLSDDSWMRLRPIYPMVILVKSHIYLYYHTI
ncbi:hypothetical protein BDQ17DRAFT_1363934 [Cyathus striatus]|nr:hypothetical protein BDQ17DRAFT_1363934 [Cyathus striatus]